MRTSGSVCGRDRIFCRSDLGGREVYTSLHLILPTQTKAVYKPGCRNHVAGEYAVCLVGEGYYLTLRDSRTAKLCGEVVEFLGLCSVFI